MPEKNIKKDILNDVITPATKLLSDMENEYLPLTELEKKIQSFKSQVELALKNIQEPFSKDKKNIRLIKKG